MLLCLPLCCFSGCLIYYKTILDLLAWCLPTLALVHEKELRTCAIYLVSQRIPIIHLFELSWVLPALGETAQYRCIRDESVVSWATLSCCHSTAGHLLLLLQKEAIRLASASTVDILATSTIATVKLAVRGYGRLIGLLFGPILCVSLAELLFTWQFITLVLWLILMWHALSCATFTKADSLLLEASLTRFLSITVQLTQLVRLQNQVLLFLDSLL